MILHIDFFSSIGTGASITNNHPYPWCTLLTIAYTHILMNGNLNGLQDVVHLVQHLLLVLQRYITLHIHFKYCWFILLLNGLSRLQHISL